MSACGQCDVTCAACRANTIERQNDRRCLHGVRHPHPCRACEDTPLTPEQQAEVDSWVAAAQQQGGA